MMGKNSQNSVVPGRPFASRFIVRFSSIRLTARDHYVGSDTADQHWFAGERKERTGKLGKHVSGSRLNCHAPETTRMSRLHPA
jgi:hypothetical protein